jgi:hypothetical protein
MDRRVVRPVQRVPAVVPYHRKSRGEIEARMYNLRAVDLRVFFSFVLGSKAELLKGIFCASIVGPLGQQ